MAENDPHAGVEARPPDFGRGLLEGPKGGRRFLGIDDGPSEKRRSASVLIVGAVCRGVALDGVLSTRIRRDGWNATPRLAEMVCRSKFHSQLHALLLDGITFGGLNVVDLPRLHALTGLPVVSVMRHPPDLDAMWQVCLKLPRPERRMEWIRRAGPIHQAGPLCFQVQGLPPGEIRPMLNKLAVNGHIPEPVRLAHLISGGVTTGESGRRA